MDMSTGQHLVHKQGGLNMAENYTLKIDAGADYFLAFRLKDGEVE